MIMEEDRRLIEETFPIKEVGNAVKKYSKDIVLTGTQYEVTSSHDDARRRRLLQDRSKGDCRL